MNLVVSKATFQFFKRTIIYLNVTGSRNEGKIQLIGDTHVVNVRGLEAVWGGGYGA